MADPMPVIRTVYLPGLVPRIIVIAGLTTVMHFVLPQVPVGVMTIVVAVGQSAVFSQIQMFAFRDHFLGIAAYRAKKFDVAIEHFEASRKRQTEKPFFDSHRAWIGVASKRSYRQIAVLNLAYAHAMNGDRKQAATLFEEILRECPDWSNGAFGANMLRADILDEPSVTGSPKAPTGAGPGFPVR